MNDTINTSYYGDTLHEIFPLPLTDNSTLHRFNNAAGISYSAIYIGNHESLSCEREKEDSMILHHLKQLMQNL